MNSRETIVETLRTALFFALAAGVALFVARKLHVDLGGLWVVLTAVTILRLNVGDSFAIARNQLLGTAVGVTFGAIFGLVHPESLGIGLAVFLTAAVCSISALRPALNISCVAASIVILLPAGNPPYMTALHRLSDTLLGAAIALLVAAIAAQSYRWLPAPQESTAK